MQLTLREMERYRAPLLVWLTVSIVAGVAGPFGTLEAMGVVGRLAYWSGVASGSVALGFGTFSLAQRFGFIGQCAVWAGMVVLLSAALHAINSVVFAGWGGLADWAYLAAIVGMVVAAVKVMVWGLASPKNAQTKAPQADPFMARLPFDVRGNLVRIEAQDHYLNVVTQRGTALILMRLGDAIGEVAVGGLQVHRSHWVALNGVTRHRRDKGRDVLVMSDGVEVPVSRSFRGAAQEAGLF